MRAVRIALLFFWNRENIYINTEKKIYSVYLEWYIVQFIHHINQILLMDINWQVNFYLKLLPKDTISGIPTGFFIICFCVTVHIYFAHAAAPPPEHWTRFFFFLCASPKEP